MAVPNFPSRPIEVVVDAPFPDPFKDRGGESLLPNGEHAITVVWSPYYQVVMGMRGVNENAAYQSLCQGAPLIEVFIGRRHVFASMEDFNEWRRQEGFSGEQADERVTR